MNDRAMSEHAMGTCTYIQDLEESYQASCKHNETTPDDHEYFRRYVWNVMALVFQRLEALEANPTP
jgi:hypothetical protein